VSSILFQQVIAGYVFVLTNSNKPVGIVKGIQGIAQLVFSFPAGYFADHTRRDRILRPCWASSRPCSRSSQSRQRL